MDSRQREQAILKEILAGNLPGFLRKLVPVKLSYQPAGGKTLTATIFVMPEYLAIGSDNDFLRIPMNLYTATAVANRLGFVLPTRKIVDAIYDQSAFHFTPEPMTAGPQMRSTEYYRMHNEMIDEQSRTLGFPLGALVSGAQEGCRPHQSAGDAIRDRLRSTDGIALSGAPIQPLSTVHGACYADYSHGIRLVSETAMVDGKLRSIYEILQDPRLARVLSDEGPIPDLRPVMTRTAGEMRCGESVIAPDYSDKAQRVPCSPRYFIVFTQRKPR